MRANAPGRARVRGKAAPNFPNPEPEGYNGEIRPREIWSTPPQETKAGMRSIASIVGAALVAALAAPAPASLAAPREHDPPAEYRTPPSTGVVPLCTDPIALAEFQRSFDDREANYWHSGLALVAWDGLSETGYRTNGLSFVPRRYCRGEALFNDGVRRKIVYNIGEDLGFIGVGAGVTWCVVGLDRNHAFGPNCKAAGP